MAESSHLPPQPKKSNKIRDIVRLQQMLKKWKKTATAKNNNSDDNAVAPVTTTNKTTTKGLKFLKKTLSFSDLSSNSNSSSQGQEDIVVKKGYLAVWVGREEEVMKKFVIPTDYLTHQAFSVLLRDAEEEFGFQQEGILKIPCDVPLFENILKMMTDKKQNQQINQRPILRSSSSTSSFFLYDQEQQQSEKVNRSSSPPPPPPAAGRRLSSSFDSQLIKTPPTTPTHQLPLYCR